jgi:hypothetical protein
MALRQNISSTRSAGDFFTHNRSKLFITTQRRQVVVLGRRFAQERLDSDRHPQIFQCGL